MKKILLLLTLVASYAFASSAAKTHDGFFASFSMGLGYQSIDYVRGDNQIVPFSESGLTTDFDFKIGGRIMNNLLLHATLAGTTLTEKFDGVNNNSNRFKYRANMSLFGVGTTYYFLDNFLATASLGIVQFHANDNVMMFNATVTSGFSDDIHAGFGFQIGGGKEWWIADEWSLGATAAILYGFAQNDAEATLSSFAISLRLTVTFN